MATSFARVTNWSPGAIFGSSATGTLATLGVVAAGAALLETALIPGLLIGGAAVLAPRLLPRGMVDRVRDRLRRAVPSPVAATAHAEEAPASETPPFDTWRAVAKTFTYRAIVTTADFGANYVVIGEFAAAASLSGLALVAGPIAYFTHEAIWHFYGPTSADATVDVPVPGASDGAGTGWMRLPSLKVSRALAKTVTYEGVTGVSEFAVNYLFVRDLVAAAGLTAFSLAIAPVVYYGHEKAWDYYDATTGRAPAAPPMKLLPAG